MAKPNNAIATVKLPGDTDARPIVPYYLGVSSSNGFVATLPETLNADKTIATTDLISSVVIEEVTSFNIGSTTYYFDSGMTWAQWVASNYNTDGWYVYDYQGGKIQKQHPTNANLFLQVTGVLKTDTITAGTTYSTTTGGGGSN